MTYVTYITKPKERVTKVYPKVQDSYLIIYVTNFQAIKVYSSILGMYPLQNIYIVQFLNFIVEEM